ncbi:glycosyltransferase family 4 protein [Halorhodospira halophila]|uniref:glycosyltransferase family 4 protein n=1 Tax=Halorhodospira halophila TaxID=1053 RepID=UPI001F5CB98A|nr:glycosyltransferase family 4 protein [Halorhodospira halophila]MBK5943634.1 hypothetical protein [Halorhodospira halophila]
MKVLYTAAYAAGSTRARMLNVVRTGESFAAVADEAVLLTRRGPVRDRATLNEQYAVGSGFRWIQVPGWMERSVFPPLVLPWILRERPDVVVARHWTLPLWTARLGIPSILEAHDLKGARPPLIRRYIRAAARGSAFCGIVTNSDAHLRAYQEAGFPAARLIATPCAVQIEAFTLPESLPADPYPANGRPRAVYAGHLYDHKGIPQILEAAAQVPEVDFHLVGGTAEDLEQVRARIAEHGLANCHLHGMQPSRDVPRWLWHADVLLLPPPEGESPLKLAEYLASGRPVVAADQPGLRALVSEREVFWAQAGDGGALAEAVRQALAQPDAAAARATAGQALAQTWSYPQRARQMLALWRPELVPTEA